ncbi:single-stranded DNA-binding protein [Eoetvoesiella caeni]
MNSINKQILVGYVGADPDVRQGPRGPVAAFNVATSESWKDKSTGEIREETEWHRVLAYGVVAEITKDRVTKGSRVYIEGKTKTRKWVKDNVERTIKEVRCDQILVLDSKPVSGSQLPPAANSQPQGAQANSNTAAATARPSLKDLDDQIPF